MLNLFEAVTFLGLLISTAFLFRQWRSVQRQLNAQEEKLEHLNYLAYYDELTHIPNQAYFKKHLRHVVARAERSKHRFAVFYIDLDDFKPFNDQYGHRMGDQILKVAATAIENSLREVDFPARFSSDEFVAVLEETSDIEVLEMIAQRLLDNIYKSTQEVGGDHDIAASIGISIYPDHGEAVNELIDMADHAMYVAKQNGKNRYVFA